MVNIELLEVIWSVLPDDFCYSGWGPQSHTCKLTILMRQCVTEGGRAGVGPFWVSRCEDDRTSTWFDKRKRPCCTMINVYMLDACQPSGPTVSKLAIWLLPLYCLNEIWSEGVENVVPAAFYFCSLVFLIRHVWLFDRSWYIAICDDLSRIGTIDNATPAWELFFLAWALIK